jgi:transcriptional regulator with XRE-family HTH domain
MPEPVTSAALASLPAAVRDRRHQLGLSIIDAAAQIGVARNTLSRFENGAEVMSGSLLRIVEWMER